MACNVGPKNCVFCGLDFRYLCALAVELHLESCSLSSPQKIDSQENHEDSSSRPNQYVDLTTPSISRQGNPENTMTCETSLSIFQFQADCEMKAALGPLNPETSNSICLDSAFHRSDVQHSQDLATDALGNEHLPQNLWDRLERQLVNTAALKNNAGTLCDTKNSAELEANQHDSFKSVTDEYVRQPLRPWDSVLNQPCKLKKPAKNRNLNDMGYVNAVLSTSDSTQMPEYATMDIENLKALLGTYGVRPGPKRYMVEKLCEIWTRLQAARQAPTEESVGTNAADYERAEQRKRQRRAQQEERDRRTLVAAVEALRAHPVLYERILLLESLCLEEVADTLAEEGVKISMRLLGHLLDETGVPYTHGSTRRSKVPPTAHDKSAVAGEV